MSFSWGWWEEKSSVRFQGGLSPDVVVSDSVQFALVDSFGHFLDLLIRVSGLASHHMDISDLFMPVSLPVSPLVFLFSNGLLYS